MEIRPMTAADLTEVRTVSESARWGDLTPHFAFYLTHPAYRPLVAEVDGRVAGTGVAICRGTAGWVGNVAVLPEFRSHGLGRALTARVLEELEQQGCRTQILLATPMGRPLYEQLGFTAECDYAILSGPSLHAVPRHARLRPMAPADLPAVFALDRAATGEDRSAEIEAWRANGWVMTDARTGAVSAYHVRPSWGAGPVVAADPEDGRTLTGMVRALTGQSGSDVTVLGLPAANEAALEELEAAGFAEVGRPVRMVRGEPLTWNPAALWGRFSGAMG